MQLNKFFLLFSMVYLFFPKIKTFRVITYKVFLSGPLTMKHPVQCTCFMVVLIVLPQTPQTKDIHRRST